MRYLFFILLLISWPSLSQIKSEIIDFPDVEAEYPGGTEAMQIFIQRTVQYPDEAVKNGQMGKVYLEFVVEVDGRLSNIKVVRSSGAPSLDKEAMRTLQKMPRWIPGEARGKNVRVRCRIPINFTLSDK